MYEAGSVFSPDVLDITEDDLMAKFMEVMKNSFFYWTLVFILIFLNQEFNIFVQGIANVASVSLAIGYPTVASVPHSIVNGFKVSRLGDSLWKLWYFYSILKEKLTKKYC